MSIATRTIEELVQELSPRLRSQVRTFIEFVLTKNKRPQKRKLRQDWAGALKTEGYTSEEAIIVSFDKDFDKTPNGRMTPAQVLNS